MQGVERVQEALSNVGRNHIALLYGRGVQDRFISLDYFEIGVDEALLQTLKQNGYERVAFLAPHRPVFFLDSYSRQTVFPSHDSLNSESIRREGSHSSRRMRYLCDGPLSDMLLLDENSLVAADQDTSPGMGDLHAIRLLDTLLKDEQIRTAVVILQAETTLHYFDDPRTLAGIIGEWERLPADNDNLCVLVFSAIDALDMVRLAGTLPVPELRAAVQTESQQRLDRGMRSEIGTPTKTELIRLFKYLQRSKEMKVDEFDKGKLAEWMAAESQLMRDWMGRLLRLPAEDVLDVDNAKKRGWFSSTRDTRQTLEERLARFIGLDGVKQRFRELSAWLQVQKMKENNLHQIPVLHMVFSGNPGTGKTSMARLVGEVYHDLGLLKRGHLVEANAADLVAGHVGGTALKTNQLIDRALDGVLFIDEAYTLTESQRGGFGAEAMETLLARMENERDRLVVIAAGYPLRMKQFLDSNPGLQRRFPKENYFIFENYSEEELWQIFLQMLTERGLKLDRNTEDVVRELIASMVKRQDANFGNAGEMRNLVESMERLWAVRIMGNGKNTKAHVTEKDIPDHYRKYLHKSDLSVEMLWKEFDHLIGLKPVKQYLKLQVQRQHFELLRTQRTEHLPAHNHIKHLAFLGNPGTGKTTVARLLGKIFQSMGLLLHGHVVEVSRSDLVAGYVGQTAVRTKKVIQEALDGILFIDEAYSLSRGGANDFGQEAIDTLVKSMEDYKERLVVIAAGYPLEMEIFFQKNPGLRSRFQHPITFPDFTREELIEIIHAQSLQEGYVMDEEVCTQAGEWLEQLRSQEPQHFGNARTALLLYEYMKGKLADRVMQLDNLDTIDFVEDDLYSTFSIEDLDGFCHDYQASRLASDNNWLFDALSLPGVLNETERPVSLKVHGAASNLSNAAGKKY